MKYKAIKATVDQPYRAKLSKDYEAKGTVDDCDHVDGCWYCVTCDKAMRTEGDKDAHLYQKPRGRAEAHTLAWWCFVCDEPVVPHLRLP